MKKTTENTARELQKEEAIPSELIGKCKSCKSLVQKKAMRAGYCGSCLLDYSYMAKTEGW